MYDETYDAHFSDRFQQKASINHLTEADLAIFETENGINLRKGILKYADGVLIGEQQVEESVLADATEAGVPTLPFQTDEYEALNEYVNFYKTILGKSFGK